MKKCGAPKLRRGLWIPAFAEMTGTFALLALTACGLGDGSGNTIGPVEKQAVFVLPAGSPDQLSQAQQDSAAQFLTTLPPAGITMATIESGPAESPEKLAQFESFLRGEGVPADRLQLRNIAENAPLTLQVVYRQWDVPSRAECAHWGESGLFNQNSTVTEHLGCADQRDLALQVADPNDLVRGQSDPSAVPETATSAAVNYLTGKIAAASSSQPSSGTSGAAGTSDTGGATTTP